MTMPGPILRDNPVAFILVLLTLLTAACVEDSDPDPVAADRFGNFSRSLDRDGRNPDFDRSIEAMVRAGRQEEAERALRELIQGAPRSELRTRLLRTSSDSLSFDGWEQVLDRLDPALMAERKRADLARSGPGLQPVLSRIYDRPISAIGVDISWHVIENLRDPSEPMAFEVSYYPDGPYLYPGGRFHFSASDHAAILAMGDRGLRPWQGSFADSDNALSVRGVTPLLLAIERSEASSGRARTLGDRALANLARWWVFLVVDHALDRELQDLRSARPAVLILGTHDFWPHALSVHSIPG